MTGLERWAADNGTTAQEIRILAMSESPDGWEAILGPSLTGPDAFPSGRDTALLGMLERGRSGGIGVSTETVASVMGRQACDVVSLGVTLMGLMPKDTAWNVLKDDGAGVDSAALPHLVLAMAGADLQETADRLAEMLNDAARPKPPKNPKGKKPQKKGKYSVSKTALAAMLKPDDGEMPIREIRMFLLSVPGAKPADIAVMSDQEAAGLFSAEYASVRMGQGTVIMPAADYEKLVDFMGTLSTYYVPSADGD